MSLLGAFDRALPRAKLALGASLRLLLLGHGVLGAVGWLAWHLTAADPSAPGPWLAAATLRLGSLVLISPWLSRQLTARLLGLPAAARTPRAQAIWALRTALPIAMILLVPAIQALRLGPVLRLEAVLEAAPLTSWSVLGLGVLGLILRARLGGLWSAATQHPQRSLPELLRAQLGAPAQTTRLAAAGLELGLLLLVLSIGELLGALFGPSPRALLYVSPATLRAALPGLLEAEAYATLIQALLLAPVHLVMLALWIEIELRSEELAPRPPAP
ncbi:MAG: hypothetical protein U1E65_00590 [Myxococcota bacterium]